MARTWVEYQPIVNGRTGEVCGVEALLRGSLGGRSAGPRELLAHARAAGIDLVGPTLAQMADDLAIWRAQSADLPWVTMNLDVDQLAGIDLPRLIDDAWSGLPADRLVLEFTEVSALSDAQLDDVVTPIRDAGVRVAVDDFGTGASLLDQFDRVRPDIVKIDRSFVRQLGDRRPDSAMVQVTLALARSVNAETIAEGVETAGELSAVRDLGCRLVQGFLFAPAVPADRISRLLPSRVLGVGDADVGWHGSAHRRHVPALGEWRGRARPVTKPDEGNPSTRCPR